MGGGTAASRSRRSATSHGDPLKGGPTAPLGPPHRPPPDPDPDPARRFFLWHLNEGVRRVGGVLCRAASGGLAPQTRQSVHAGVDAAFQTVHGLVWERPKHPAAPAEQEALLVVYYKANAHLPGYGPGGGEGQQPTYPVSTVIADC